MTKLDKLARGAAVVFFITFLFLVYKITTSSGSSYEFENYGSGLILTFSLMISFILSLIFFVVSRPQNISDNRKKVNNIISYSILVMAVVYLLLKFI
jgi:hypothetical protein